MGWHGGKQDNRISGGKLVWKGHYNRYRWTTVDQHVLSLCVFSRPHPTHRGVTALAKMLTGTNEQTNRDRPVTGYRLQIGCACLNNVHDVLYPLYPRDLVGRFYALLPLGSIDCDAAQYIAPTGWDTTVQRWMSKICPPQHPPCHL